MIYTVGHAASYRQGIREKAANGEKLLKLGPRPASGKSPAYQGGFAVRTPEEAERLIDEFGKRGEWEPFGLIADWETDTKPAAGAWWHSLQRDSEIVDLAAEAAQ